MLTCDGVAIIRKSVKQMVLRVGLKLNPQNLLKLIAARGKRQG